MKLRKVLTAGIAALMISGSAMTAMAGQWISNGVAWCYLQDNGTFATNKWVGNYYLGANGIMLTNSWTPDGYYVGADGKWIPNAANTDTNSSIGHTGIYQWTYTKTASGAVSYANYVDTREVSANSDKSLTVYERVNGVLGPVSQVSFIGTDNYVSVLNGLTYTFPSASELVITETNGTEIHFSKIG